MLLIIYRKAIYTDLKDITYVHKECFAGYFLTSLGNRLIYNLYKTFMETDSPFIVAIDETDGSIIGFCVGVINGKDVHGIFEWKNKWLLVSKILWRCIIFDKVAINKLKQEIKAIINKRKKKKNNTTSFGNNFNFASISSISVIEKFRGTDVATTLLEEYEKLFTNMDMQQLILHVKKNNDRAISFYKKNGFEWWYDVDQTSAYKKNLQ